MKWPQVKLGMVAEINPRRDIPASISADTLVTFVPMAAVSESSASIVERIARPLADVVKGFTPFQEDDVIMAKITPCMENGKIAHARDLMNSLGFGSTEFHVVRAGPLVEARFLYYLLRQSQVREQGKQRMRGGVGQQRVPAEFLQGLTFGLPPRSEQRRIVEILDDADQLRNQRAEANAKVQRLLPALFQKLFGDPKDWDNCTDTVPLGDLVRTRGGGTPSKEKPTYWTGDVPWVSPKDMKRDFISDTQDHITLAAVQDTVGDLIPARSILVVVRGMILAHSLPIALTEREVAINQDMKALTITDDRISPVYLFASLKALRSRLLASVSTAAHGTRKLDTDRLLSVPILIPRSEQHTQFVTWFDDARAIVDATKGSTSDVGRLFEVLLYRAFSGDLTAKWREASWHRIEAEMQEQVQALERPKGNSATNKRGRRSTERAKP